MQKVDHTIYAKEILFSLNQKVQFVDIRYITVTVHTLRASLVYSFIWNLYGVAAAT